MVKELEQEITTEAAIGGEFVHPSARIDTLGMITETDNMSSFL